jgi:hypothetical protein
MPAVKRAVEFPPLASVEDVGRRTSMHGAHCRETCAFEAETQWHHRRLMTIESDGDVLIELIELAVTWPELEYSETPTIAPERWLSFFDSHRWADPDHVERIFSVATDIATTATRASRRRPVDPGAPLGERLGSRGLATSTPWSHGT